MSTFLTGFEISILKNWDIYRQKDRPLNGFINEIPNLILIHSAILDASKNNITINKSLQKVVQCLSLAPHLIEQFAKDTLSISMEQLSEDLRKFEHYLSAQQIKPEWEAYSNFSGNSTVSMYRIGNDYIDVIFSTSPSYFYHYSYQLTGIMNTELLKCLAKNGIHLGGHTRRIKQGAFTKRLLK